MVLCHVIKCQTIRCLIILSNSCVRYQTSKIILLNQLHSVVFMIYRKYWLRNEIFQPCMLLLHLLFINDTVQTFTVHMYAKVCLYIKFYQCIVLKTSAHIARVLPHVVQAWTIYRHIIVVHFFPVRVCSHFFKVFYVSVLTSFAS